MTNTIEITEEFKATIEHFIARSETDKVNHILSALVEGGYVDDEFGHLIYIEPDNAYNPEMDNIVLDAVENEIKKQLLKKFDR